MHDDDAVKWGGGRWAHYRSVLWNLKETISKSFLFLDRVIVSWSVEGNMPIPFVLSPCRR